MTGTIVNSVAIIAGGLMGSAAGKRISGPVKKTLMNALGLAVALVGVRMALSGKSELLSIGALIIGGISGELLRIEDRLAHAGEFLRKRFASESGTFVEGFVTGTVLFCTGAMSVVGSLKDGATGDSTVLYIKALLDFTGSALIAANLGIGMAFSAISVFIYQGSITLLAAKLDFLSLPHVTDAISTTGGAIILGIGLNLLEVTKIRIGNLIPALFIAIMAACYLN